LTAATAHHLGVVLVSLALGACGTVPLQERLLAPGTDGSVDATTQVCSASRKPKAMPVSMHSGDTLDTKTLRIVSWNLHKGEDDGWEADLQRFANDHDVLLLQEAVLSTPVRNVLERAGHGWRMAGAFAYNGEERGVMVASRARPLDTCTLRAFEPLAQLPKSAIVARYRLASPGTTLAIANLHGINFTLGLESFRAQIEAVAEVLAGHDGPAILAGDFNTWSLERHEVLVAAAGRLGMTPVELVPDGRRRTFGRHLDHLFVRGLRVVQAQAPEVKSSDHNPILVTLTEP
jgi:endonuclease/exonuclease/phosphatase (EEP) superfamily protein YafD